MNILTHDRHSTMLSALTIQLWEDASGELGRLDHIRPGEATALGEHKDVVYKLLMEAPPLVGELGPQEVPAEPLHTSMSLKSQLHIQQLL